MERSEQINELVAALSKAQSQFSNIIKDQTAKIVTKGGATFSYSYADLASLLDMVRNPLSLNSLAIIQCADTISLDEMNAEGKMVTKWRLIIETMLTHSSGQFIKNRLNLPIVDTGNNAIQAIGSTFTYGRRYELSSILGIASEVDDDANVVPPSNGHPKQFNRASSNESKVTDPSQIQMTVTLRDTIEKIAREKFGDLDNFKAWRIDNGLAENLEGIKDQSMEMASIWTKVREYKPTAKVA